MIPIYKPYLKKYKSCISDAIDSEWISNYGKYIALAQDKLCSILGVKYCILMNNGTSATHCLFIALKFKYPGIKKIYIPNNVFIAPYNCGLMEYDIKMFEVMKMNGETLNISTDEDYILSLDTDSAVVIVHNLGNIVNVPRLKRIRPDLIFIEDNCEGFFGKYEDKYSGTESLCSSVSFYSNKIITTGEGGAFLTNDEEIYNHMSSVYSHGMTQQRYIHNVVAYNYRMTNVCAGLLYEQLCDIDHILALKQEVFDRYDKLLSDLIDAGKIKHLQAEPNTQNALWMYHIILSNSDNPTDNITYNEIEKAMEAKDIQIRPFFRDIHKHYHLREVKNVYPMVEMANRGIMIPSYPELGENDQIAIINIIRNLL